MPNYCANRWTIEGDFKGREALVQFLETIDENNPDNTTDLDFNNIRPLNSHTVYTQSDAWGTKWNACDVERTHDDTQTVYVFQTAWGPPSAEMIREAMARFPGLTYEFHYAERGQMFYGRHGTSGPDYQAKFKWNKKHADRGADFVEAYDSEAEEDWEGVLVPALSQFQELYDMSG